MAEYVFATRALTKRYGSANVVDGVSMSIEKGQIYGLVAATARGRPPSSAWLPGRPPPAAAS